MKRITILILLCLVSLSSSYGYFQLGYHKNDRVGKFEIQVIDAESLQPVEEVFKILFFDASKEKPYAMETETDNKGCLSADMKIGSYYLRFAPQSPDSDYEIEPSPLVYEASKKNLLILEEGKISEIVKKVYKGGQIHIVAVDQNGGKVNFKNIAGNDTRASINFRSKEGLVGTFDSDYISDYIYSKGADDFSEGEVIIKRIPPGNYEIVISFGILGCKDININDVQIEREKTFYKEVIADIYTKKFIHGKIYDNHGNPLKRLLVEIGSASCLTDNNGYYKIYGINEGFQSIYIASDSRDFYGLDIATIYHIEIKYNPNMIKDFIIDID